MKEKIAKLEEILHKVKVLLNCKEYLHFPSHKHQLRVGSLHTVSWQIYQIVLLTTKYFSMGLLFNVIFE